MKGVIARHVESDSVETTKARWVTLEDLRNLVDAADALGLPDEAIVLINSVNLHGVLKVTRSQGEIR